MIFKLTPAGPPMVRRLRVDHRRSKTTWTGRHAWSLGMRFGYWPCLRGPFVALDLGTHRVDIWFGFPSYKPGGRL